MREAIVAFVIFATAAFLPRSPRWTESIWEPLVVRGAFLGDDYAAADAFWLRVIQLLGSEGAAAEHYPGLETWLDGLTTLDPTFGNAYFVGSVFLVAEPSRAASVDRILARGEAALPNDFRLPFSRGFLAYFGDGDAATAAAHYRRASTLPDAPAYLAAFARRLSEQSNDCDNARQRYKELMATSEQGARDRLQQESLRIAIACEERALETATASFRLRFGNNPVDIEDMLARGVLLRRPLAEAGKCWSTDEFGNATYHDCP